MDTFVLRKAPDVPEYLVRWEGYCKSYQGMIYPMVGSVAFSSYHIQYELYDNNSASLVLLAAALLSSCGELVYRGNNSSHTTPAASHS